MVKTLFLLVVVVVAAAAFPALQVLCSAANPGHIAQLMEKIGEKDAQVAAFLTAARKGDLEKVRTFLDQGMSANTKNKSGDTALMEAAENGHVEVVKLLLDRGSDGKAKNEIGETALEKAVRAKQFPPIEELVIKRKLFDLSDLFNASVKWGYTEVVKIIFEKRDPKVEEDNLGLTLSCRYNRLDLVQFFLSRQADPNCDKGTPLLSAAYNRASAELVKMLLDKGANPNPALDDGRTPLWFACQTGNLDMARVLIEKGANVNVRNKEGTTVLMDTLDTAAGSYDRLVKLLLEKGADPNVARNDGLTALMFAAYQGREEAVKMLVEKKVNVNAQSKEGVTALKLAERRGYKNIVELLKKHGAN